MEAAPPTNLIKKTPPKQLHKINKFILSNHELSGVLSRGRNADYISNGLPETEFEKKLTGRKKKVIKKAWKVCTVLVTVDCLC